MALAAILAMGGLFYFYDLILLVRTGSVNLSVAVGFIAGTVFAFGLAWGIWRLEPWARVVMVWLLVLVMGVMLFAIPFTIKALWPGVLWIGVAWGILRYLSLPSTRRAFQPLDL
jgi:hypothetical protein